MTDNDTDDLVGRSLRGRSLVGADLSDRDVRGADFTGANLRSVSFRNSIFGVPPKVGAAILGIAMLISVFTGTAIGWMVDEIRGQVNAEEWDAAAAGGSLVLLLLVFIAISLWRGFDTAIKVTVGAYRLVLAGNIIANLIWEEVE